MLLSASRIYTLIILLCLQFEIRSSRLQQALDDQAEHVQVSFDLGHIFVGETVQDIREEVWRLPDELSVDEAI